MFSPAYMLNYLDLCLVYVLKSQSMQNKDTGSSAVVSYKTMMK